MEQTSKKNVTLRDNTLAQAIIGKHEDNLRRIGEHLGLEVSSRGNIVTLEGARARVERGRVILEELQALAARGEDVTEAAVDNLLRLSATDQDLPEIAGNEKPVPRLRRRVVPKTPRQKDYLGAIESKTVTFGIGPAGTGKTYLAMAMATSALLAGEVSRLVLTRPAVEAGEKLGYLPGSMIEKVNPYLRPLYDALHDMLDIDKAGRLIDMGSIEVAPLAFMRGRTLNESFVILDEAQNTTPAQMKMFLTRLGYGSRAVITGDITQIDLPPGQESGLVDAIGVLTGVEGIHITHFDGTDVVRHPIIQSIVEAYERRSRAQDAGDKPGTGKQS